MANTKLTNRKGIAPIILILIVVAVIAALGGYAWYSKYKFSGCGSPDPIDCLNREHSLSSNNLHWLIYNGKYATFKYPSSWQVKDDNYIRDNITYPLFHIMSSDRFDLPGYEGVGAHYLIQVSLDPTTNKIESVADFAKVYTAGDQSPWNTNLDKNITEATDEYDLGQQIISSFKSTESTSTINVSTTGVLRGTVSIGPICPVETNPPQPGCMPTAATYVSHEFLVLSADQTKTISSFHADANGKYSIALAPGTYVVVTAKTGMSYMSKDLPKTVIIKANQVTTLSIDVDTGIR